MISKGKVGSLMRQTRYPLKAKYRQYRRAAQVAGRSICGTRSHPGNVSAFPLIRVDIFTSGRRIAFEPSDRDPSALFRSVSCDKTRVIVK